MEHVNSAPDAMLLMGSQCPWCPAVHAALLRLLEDGTIASLQAVDIEEQPELAEELAVRSVPWVRIGPFELEGMRSESELRTWANKAGTTSGMADWLDELLTNGKLSSVDHYLQRDPSLIDALFLLFENPDTKLNTRIGISALMEGLEGSTLLLQQFDRLVGLLSNENSAIRGDACHFLSLTGSPGAIESIRPLLNDPDPDIRIVAQDCLDQLAHTPLH